MLHQDEHRDAVARGRLLNAVFENGYTGSSASVQNLTGVLNPFLYPVTIGSDRLELVLPTGASPVLVSEVRSSPSPVWQNPILTPAEMLSIVRDTFLLNVSDAARVFKVSRPTIYQWMNLTDIEQVRALQDRNRIKDLYRLSRIWAGMGRLTGRWANQVLRNGQSIIDLLSADKIDEQAIIDAHQQLLTASDFLRQGELSRSLSAARAMEGAFSNLAKNEEKRRKGRS